MGTICTVGPSSDNVDILKRLKEANVHIFRINMSHAEIDSIQELYKKTTQLNIELAIDTEGAQIRTKLFNEEHLMLEVGEVICISSSQKEGIKTIGLYPQEAFNELRHMAAYIGRFLC